MPAPISLTWLALTLALLIYTFWDAPRWYKTPVHSALIAAVTYGPAHFLTMQWSPVAEVLLFIVACALWATFLHKMVRFTLWDLPPYVPKQRTTKTVDPQIAAAYDNLGVPQPSEVHTESAEEEESEPVKRSAVITKTILVHPPSDNPPGFDEDEWEIFTPANQPQPFSTNGAH